MEAVPRLPMINFELKVATEPVNFGPKIKQYIASYYHEDAESYSNEINNLEALRAAAVRPAIAVSGCQTLKKYYCQLHFLKSRFPMEENQPAAVYFSWRDGYTNMSYSVPDIEFELMNILYNIGALHSKLGSEDNRTTPAGMKMACTHFQCAAWAFHTVRETYPQMVNLVLAPEILEYMHLVCLAQAQECILEKSMLDNRKATIIAKVAVQVVEYYKQSLKILQSGGEEGPLSDLVGSRTFKEWIKYLFFKVAYHSAIALLYQGQQAEEQQKMGERVAFYQAASEQLQEARKKSSNLLHQQEINEALAFTNDVIEGKCKAAKNENEFIYHEEVPDIDALQEVKGASLVKGIPFNINDAEVSGTDIFSRLVPMETHEASSMYSEQKAQFIRQWGGTIESKDHTLAEFMSSLQTDVITQIHQANGLPQQIIDRAAAMSAKPRAIQDLIDAMGKLSNSYQEVEAMLKEIDMLLKEEEQKEQEYQSRMGARPPSIIITDLKREAAKYQEAHSKASESNQNLHRAMTSHIANLKILSQPLNQLQQQIPSITLPSTEIDENSLKEMESLLSKVDEMKQQRAMLWNQLHEAVQNDDITSVLITKSSEQPLDVIFQKELEKHKTQVAILEQNMSAQDNICKALVDAYARFTKTRRYLSDMINLRNTTISALISSYDTYDDLLSKANKGIEFYGKLETNVTKLLQRIKSTCKVQDEEREQMLSKAGKKPEPEHKSDQAPAAPKLKDYLNSLKLNTQTVLPSGNAAAVSANQTVTDNTMWPPSIRPAPVGSEMGKDQQMQYVNEPVTNYSQIPDANEVDVTLAERMANLKTGGTNQKQAAVHGHYSAVPLSQYHTYSMPLQYSQASYPIQVSQQMPIASVPNASVNHSYQQPLNYSQPSQYPQPPVDYSNTAYTSQKSDYPSQIQTPQHFQHPASAQSPYSQYSQNPAVVKTPPPAIQSSSQQHQSVNSQHYYPTSQTLHVTPIQTYSQYQPQVSYQATTSHQFPTVTTQYSNYPQQAYQDSTAVNYPMGQIQNSDLENKEAQSAKSAITNTTYMTLSNTVPSLGNQDFSKTNQESYHYGTNAYMYTYPASAYSSDTSSGYLNTSTAVNDVGSYNTLTTPSTYYSANTNIDSNFGSYPTSSTFPVTDYPISSTSTNVVTSLTSNYNGTNALQNEPYYYYQNNEASTSGYNYYTAYGGQSEYYNQTANYQNNNSQNYYSTQSTSGYQNVPTNVQNLPTTQNVATSASVSVPTDKGSRESSNIDLLSGLDFSVSHPPLQPQKSENKEFAIEVKPKLSEQSSKNSLTSKSEEKPKAYKVESPPLLVKLFERINRRGVFDNLEIDGKQFLQELEKFEKFVEILCNKTLSGPTMLDMRWKEIQDKQELEQQKQIISVARCYPAKNRYPDILPYDHSRVKLISKKDDYINASILKNVTPHCPTYLVTQAPLPTTIGDFWTMIWEQKIDFIICLLSDQEMDKDIYWPKEKNQQLTYGNWIISLQSVEVKESWTQRILSLHRLEERDSRNFVHMQFTVWPGSLFPPLHIFVNFIKESINCWKEQQRTTSQCIVIHCSSGIGRSGVFCLLTTAIIEFLNKPTAIPDLLSISSSITTARRNVLRDREHLKFAFQVFLHYLQDVKLTCFHDRLANEKPEKEPSLDRAPENTDPLSSLDPLWATKRK